MPERPSMITKTLSTKAEDTGDANTVRVICSTEDTDRQGEVVVQSGIDLTAYRRNPVVLWQHSPDHPVARCTSIAVEGGRLVANMVFPPPGVSAKADEVRGLVKAGVLSGVSVGLRPIDTAPMDPNDTRKGAPVRYLRSELMEFSWVSIPANPNALVISRSAAASQNRKLTRERARREIAEMEARAEAHVRKHGPIPPVGPTAAPAKREATVRHMTRDQLHAWVDGLEAEAGGGGAGASFGSVAERNFAIETGRARRDGR